MGASREMDPWHAVSVADAAAACLPIVRLLVHSISRGPIPSYAKGSAQCGSETRLDGRGIWCGCERNDDAVMIILFPPHSGPGMTSSRGGDHR